MSGQAFRDESNWKHQPNTEHYVDDKFEKGTDTRNWKKNLDERIDETESSVVPEHEQEDSTKRKVMSEDSEEEDSAISNAGKKRQEGKRY